MSSSVLHTEKLCKTFSNGGVQQHVIKNLDIDIREKDFTIIMGASGSGKSTLLYALSGMDKPTLGRDIQTISLQFSDAKTADSFSRVFICWKI